MSTVQNVVYSMGEKIFPGISKTKENPPLSSRSVAFVYNVRSSLILQMCLYFNLTYFPVWFTIMLASYIYKHDSFLWFPYVILGVGLLAMVGLEATRLYLGMAGNLSELVTELSTFWFITLLLQLPLVIIYLVMASSLGHIIEMCAQTISTLFIVVELGVAFVTLRDVARQQRFLAQSS